MKMIKQLLVNWKTTSAGLTLLIGAWVHLAFALKNHTADETTWTTTLLATVSGIGLILAGDSDKSATKEEAKALTAVVAQNSAAIQVTPAAIATGDTSLITKAMARQAEKSPVP